MWIPNTAQEVEDAVRAGAVDESPSFDAKLCLPPSKKNIEIAKDIAAMATDGGVLLYGVGEDENGAVSVIQPLDLGGVPERISQIVSTSIAEVPFIDIRTLPCGDGGQGYVVVVVPQSARAPHMVTVNGDHRFYGREAKANRILNEGDVARLYERRQRWEIDRELILEDVISAAPVGARDRLGFVHAFTRPVAPDQGLLERAQERMGAQPGAMLQWLLVRVQDTVLRGRYGPTLEHATQLRRHGGDMWRWSTLSPDEVSAMATAGADSRYDPTSLVTMDLNMDGRGQLFCGRATDERMSAPDARMLIEVVVAGNVEAFFAVMAGIYDAAGYYGAVDVGLAVTGVRGAHSERAHRNFGGPSYPVDSYTRTDRIAAAELREPSGVGQRLLRHFFEATSGIDGYNPWTDSGGR